MKHIALTILLFSNIFALLPFSLEGVKNVNIKLFDKSKLVYKELKQKITKEIKEELTKVGIKTSSEEFSNFIVKIEAVKIKNEYIVNTSIFLAEDIIPSRDTSLESLGITYQKNDFFTTEDFEVDLYESVIEYLLFDLLEQYRDENE